MVKEALRVVAADNGPADRAARLLAGRTIFVTADAVGGVWPYAIDLARGLVAGGAHVELAVLGPSPDLAQREEVAAIPGVTMQLTNLPLEWLATNATAVMKAGALLAECAERSGCDLVHLNSPALAAGLCFGVPLVVTCHSCVATWWHAVRGGALPADFAWRRQLTEAGLRAADRVIAPSAAFAAALAQEYELPVEPQVIANGRARQARLACPPGLPARFLFTAGRLWDDGKNVRAVDRIAAMLDVPVFAAGPLAGPDGTRIALPNLRLLGPLRSGVIAGCMAQAGTFVSLARYEPFGLAVLEAAQAGCALVLSDIASFREIWGDAACYVDCDDSEAGAAALRRLLEDPLLCRRRGEAARARAARYEVAAMVDATAQLYRTVLPAVKGRHA